MKLEVMWEVQIGFGASFFFDLSFFLQPLVLGRVCSTYGPRPRVCSPSVLNRVCARSHQAVALCPSQASLRTSARGAQGNDDIYGNRAVINSRVCQ